MRDLGGLDHVQHVRIAGLGNDLSGHRLVIQVRVRLELGLERRGQVFDERI